MYTLAETFLEEGFKRLEIAQTRIKGFGQKKRQEVKGVPISLKDTWESTFSSAVFPGWASQQRSPSIKGVSFNTQTLSQSSILMQTQCFNTHLLLPEASRVAALLSGGFGSFFCCSFSPSTASTAGVDRQSPHWSWVLVGSPSSCVSQLLSWQNTHELECWAICKAWCSPQVLHQFRWKGNTTIDWSPTWDPSWKSISLGLRLQLWSIPFLEQSSHSLCPDALLD